MILEIDVAPDIFSASLHDEMWIPYETFTSATARSLAFALESRMHDQIRPDNLMNSVRAIVPPGRDWGDSDIRSLRDIDTHHGIGFWNIDITFDSSPGFGLCFEDISPGRLLLQRFIHANHGDVPFIRITQKKLKTKNKFRIRLFNPFLAREAFVHAQRSFMKTQCTCPVDLLAAVVEGCHGWWLHFICKVCGNRYYCDCFSPAFKKLLIEAKASIGRYGDGGWPHSALEVMANAKARSGICQMCTGTKSSSRYCSEMYGSSVMVSYGWFIKRTAVEHDITDREAENLIRASLGIPQIGEGWLNETDLFRTIQKIFGDCIVEREARPPWLGRQRLDIFVPERSLAIEYNGIQHYRPVSCFGGEAGFAKTRERDATKKRLCEEHGVALVSFKYTDDTSMAAVRRRLADFLPRKVRNSRRHK